MVGGGSTWPTPPGQLALVRFIFQIVLGDENAREVVKSMPSVVQGQGRLARTYA